MSTILQKAQSVFAARELLQVEVPEWSDDPAIPVVVYYRVPTAKQLGRAAKESPDNPMQMTCRLVAYCALDANGHRIFTDGNWMDLETDTDPRGIARIGAALMAQAKMGNVEAAEKN